MRQYQFLTLLGLCLVLMALAGCGSSASPTPTVAPVPATATAQPLLTVAPPPGLTTITNTIVLASFQINLPEATEVLYPSAEEWQQQLGQLTEPMPHLGAYLTTLTTIAPAQETIALAQPAPTVSLLAAVVPADGLTLQTYLSAAQGELAQSRLTLGSGIVVQSAAIRYDLHEAGIPLATLQYTLPATDATATGATAGYQVAMLDQQGAHLLLLTFITQPAAMAAAQPQIETILGRLQDTTIDQ